MKNLGELEAKLRKNLRDILDRNDAIRMRMSEKDPGGNWSFEDLGTDAEFDDVLDALGDQERIEAFSTWQALNRIGEGTYGRCLNCGRQISDERLQALPAAEYCIDCAGRLESED